MVTFDSTRESQYKFKTFFTNLGVVWMEKMMGFWWGCTWWTWGFKSTPISLDCLCLQEQVMGLDQIIFFPKSIWWFLLWLKGRRWKYFLPLEWRWFNFNYNGRLLHCRWLNWTPRCAGSSTILLLLLPLLLGIYLLIQGKTMIKCARMRDTWFLCGKYP